MRKFAVALAILMLGIQSEPTFCTESSKTRAKSRTLTEVIELVSQQGQDDKLDSNMAEAFGLGATELPWKRLRYKQKTSPDGKEHGFSLLYSASDDKCEKPIRLSLSVVKATKVGDAWNLDGYVFLASLTGRLERALHNQGKFGDVNAKKLELDSSTKKLFDAEMAFHKKTVPSLDLKPAE